MPNIWNVKINPWLLSLKNSKVAAYGFFYVCFDHWIHYIENSKNIAKFVHSANFESIQIYNYHNKKQRICEILTVSPTSEKISQCKEFATKCRYNKNQRIHEILKGIVQPSNTFHNIVDTAQSQRILHNFSEYCAIPSSIAQYHRVLCHVCNVIIYWNIKSSWLYIFAKMVHVVSLESIQKDIKTSLKYPKQYVKF